MKKALLFSFCTFILSTNLFASLLTVSNDTTIPAQYSDLQLAIDSASAGDTLYVHGTNNYYSANYSMNKKLTIIGPGFNPAYGGLPANIKLLTLEAGASGSSLIGLRFICDICGISVGLNDSLQNISFIRNEFRSSVKLFYFWLPSPGHRSNNIRFINNIIDGNNHNLIINYNTNVFVYNNIFTGGSGIIDSEKASVTIANNLFLGAGTGQGSCVSNVKYAVFSNNIFWSISPVGSQVDSCAYNNNLSYQAVNDTMPLGSNIGSGNFIGMDPQFVNATSHYPFNYSYNYFLQAASIGHNAGTDGSDIGIFGGNNPFPDLSGMANIPVITNFTIPSSSVPVGGSLNVNIKAKKHD